MQDLQDLATRGDAARSRLRRIVPTLLLILISVMIVRDIFARRWGGPPPPASDVTQRSR
jgi:peptidoglycan/LPS O-acetylase OafA/YrhL